MKKIIIAFAVIGVMAMIVVILVNVYSTADTEVDMVVVADAKVTAEDTTSACASIDMAFSDDEIAAQVKTDSKFESIWEGVYDNLYDTDHVHLNPQFPGGDSIMYQWIYTHIIYPESAVKKGVKGRVTVWFIVECDGSISNVKVLRGKEPALDKEAVRVVSSMPKWNPGLLYDKPVRVEYILPVTFCL